MNQLKPRTFPARHIMIAVALMLWAVEMILLGMIIAVAYTLYAPILICRIISDRLQDSTTRVVTRLNEYHEKAQSHVLGFSRAVQSFLVPMVAMEPASPSKGSQARGKRKRRRNGS